MGLLRQLDAAVREHRVGQHAQQGDQQDDRWL
jgi:hypothetical protein